MVFQNWQVEILFSKLYSHSFLSALVLRVGFERNIKPITAPAQGSALHAQNIQTQPFQIISAQLLHSILGSPSSPLHPKHQTDRSLQNILAAQSQQALPCNICCSPAPCHIRENRCFPASLLTSLYNVQQTSISPPWHQPRCQS